MTTLDHAAALARAHTAEAIGALLEVMRDRKAKGERLKAAMALLERAYGRPAQAVPVAPVRKAVGQLLADLSDDDLLKLAHAARVERRPLIEGVGGQAQNEGPQRRVAVGGPQPAIFTADSRRSQEKGAIFHSTSEKHPSTGNSSQKTGDSFHKKAKPTLLIDENGNSNPEKIFHPQDESTLLDEDVESRFDELFRQLTEVPYDPAE